ncbi:MAG: right-handed parallel beta-helix repeat-containing protein [Candidatus Delongbacteria bacterium]|jgi:hypothetical protein|nr:right-handed parallel beta-helix repeat-containing protein [Candidatus Delongbacteria bacterium]
MKKILFILFVLIMSLICSAKTTYVTVEGNGSQFGTSWANALPGDSLQSAINKSNADDKVWVCMGIYKPNSWPNGGTEEREKHFSMKRGVKLYGGFNGSETNIDQRNISLNETILSGDLGIEDDNSDNCYHVIKNPEKGLGTTSLLDGFTITGGNGGSGGAMFNDDTAPTIRNCTFRNNYAQYCGGAIANALNFVTPIIIENCLFYDNHAQEGGAIHSSGVTTVITNCTIVNNTAELGGGIYVYNTNRENDYITNNIIWGNSSDQFYQYASYAIEFTFNAVEGGYDGYCNIELSSNNEGDTNSPYFTDPTNNDWSLQSSSPCIDTGVYWSALEDPLETDINLSPRPQGLCNDIGAYEFESADPNAVLPTISTLPAENISATYATLKGNISGDGGVQVVTKGMKYSTVSGFDPQTDGTLIRQLELLGEEEFEIFISNLTPETTYYYRAYCENRIGSIYAPEEQSFITLPKIYITPDANGILYVKEEGLGDGSSWTNALNGNELQNGIDSSAVKEIWVAKGKYIPTNWPCTTTVHKLDENDFVYRFQDKENNKAEKYNGTTEREKHFALRPDKKLYGGFDGTETSIDQRDTKVNETILSGDIGTEGYAQDNTYHVVYHFSEDKVDSSSVIDGFTIQDGYADGTIYDDSYFGGGIFNRCSSPTIRNCTIKNNYGIWGGGMINGHSGSYGYSKPIITNTIITQNLANIEGGGIYDISGYPQLLNCVISKNSAGEKGGGIFHWANYDYPQLITDTLKIQHCTIADNIAPDGSGLYFDTLKNEEIIQNSIIWGDEPVITYKYEYVDGPIQTIDFCGISGGYYGDFNINLSANNEGDINSPYFNDPLNNDYSLQYDSACKDKAMYLYKTDDDILGTLRPQGAAYDMGAYEYETAEPNAVAPTLNTSFVENETASTALCHTDVTSNGGAPLVERGIKTSQINGFDPEITGRLYSFKEDFTGTKFSTLVSDLLQNNKYYYRSYAENRMGYTYGQQKDFTTSSITPDENGIFYIKENGTGDGTSWNNALSGKDIQTAIEYNPASEIWIAKGTYKPNSWPQGGSENREKHFSLRDKVKLYGGFEGTETDISERNFKINKTILSGDIGIEKDSTDNCYHVFVNVDIPSIGIIDGFTISNGFENIKTLTDEYYYSSGAGMHNNSCHLTIRNCEFSNNYTIFRGGGIYNSPGSNAIYNMNIENCNFINNFSEDNGGAYYSSGRYKIIFSKCVFSNNMSNGTSSLHVFDWNYCLTEIYNCLFYENHSVNGSGISLSFSNSFADEDYNKIINTTIVNNSSINGCGGIDLINLSYYDLYVKMYNTVIFNNDGEQIYANDGSDIPVINNCAIEGGINFEHIGENNITLSPNNAGDEFSPYFSDPDNNNYMIQEYSPLRDAGVRSHDFPIYDITGNPRDNHYDIGCYEYDETSIDNSELIIDNCELYQNYPNPFNPSTNIRFYISKTDKVELFLYNVAGQLVKKILDKELKAGNHNILFEASDLNSGMYYYTLKTGDMKISKKMLLLK